nr:hypothetical protein [Hyella patelloides]
MESKDYQKIAKAILFIRQHHLSQPDLITVAQNIGLSEYHFQRLFTQWAAPFEETSNIGTEQEA